jgi:hypothetical protein
MRPWDVAVHAHPPDEYDDARAGDGGDHRYLCEDNNMMMENDDDR